MTLASTAAPDAVRTLDIRQDILVHARPALAFEALLDLVAARKHATGAKGTT